jgi:hypothetical protein
MGLWKALLVFRLRRFLRSRETSRKLRDDLHIVGRRRLG